jgi:hypothetical protein
MNEDTKDKHNAEQGIEIRPSAFKHGYTEADVKSVFGTFILNRPLEDREAVELVLGFSTAGDLLEMFYEITDENFVVFHLMRCRRQFIELL